MRGEATRPEAIIMKSNLLSRFVISVAVCLMGAQLPAQSQTKSEPGIPSIETSDAMLDVIIQHAQRRTEEIAFASFATTNDPELVERWLESSVGREEDGALQVRFEASELAQEADERYYAMHAAAYRARGVSLLEFSRTAAVRAAWAGAALGKDYARQSLLAFTRELYPSLADEAGRIDALVRKAVVERGGDPEAGNCLCAYFFSSPDLANPFFTADSGSDPDGHRRSWWSFVGAGPAVAGELHVFSKRGDSNTVSKSYRQAKQLRGFLACSAECGDSQTCTLRVSAANMFGATTHVYVRRGGGIAKRHAIAETSAVSRSRISGPTGLLKDGWNNPSTDPVLRKSHDQDGYVLGVVGIIEIIVGGALYFVPGAVAPATALVIDGVSRLGVLWDAGNGSAGYFGPTPSSDDMSIIEAVTLNANAGEIISELRFDGTTAGDALGRQGADAFAAFASSYGMGLIAHDPKCSAGVMIKPSRLTLSWSHGFRATSASRYDQPAVTISPSGNATSNADKVVDNLVATLQPYSMSGLIDLNALKSLIRPAAQGSFTLP